MRSVLRMTSPKSGSENSVRKFANPTHLLPKKPFTGLYFWNAPTRPYRGIYEKMKKNTIPGSRNIRIVRCRHRI